LQRVEREGGADAKAKATEALAKVRGGVGLLGLLGLG
jgi:hypothetical protein